MTLLLALPVLALGLLATAQPESQAEAQAEPPHRPSIEERVTRLEEENRQLTEELAEVKQRPNNVASLTVTDRVKFRLGAYVDLGFFDAGGDGVAYVRDVGKSSHPNFSNVPWVFTGDPWSNPVNSQGDSADLGLDRTNVPRYDPIHSGGKPSFIVNIINLNLSGSFEDKLFFETSLNFEPRQGLLGTPGDNLDIDLAYLEWKPWSGRDLHFFVGKFESTFGLEYRRRKAPDRFGITPSLVARYTVGTPTGLKFRGSLFEGRGTFNFAITNGGMLTEKFSHFFNEIDRNTFKTLSGRISAVLLEGDAATLEWGFSGVYGAQDLQSNSRIPQFQIGTDLLLSAGDFTFRAELLRSVAKGQGLSSTTSSVFTSGGYAEASYQITPWMGSLLRLDFRKADLFTFPNLYLTNTARATVGLRFDITWNVIAKIEYLRVQELSGPEINDDVFTTSLVFRM